ncbi:MAG: ABC transporter substrate-binding protein [Burkholderiales bacterium]|nr:ABC transporter substrate-binding protein [Burkholderiales bacterium]
MKNFWIFFGILTTIVFASETTIATKQIASQIVSKKSPATNVISNINCLANSPCLVVKVTSEKVLNAVNVGVTQKQTMSLIKNVITPQVNFELMTKYALGNNWKLATESQQQELVDNFKNLLIFTYSSALSKFKGAKINISNQNVSEKKASVSSNIILPNSTSNNQPINVEYDLAKTIDDNTWKIYDIKIENASLVTTYRNQFNEIIQTSKINGLIKQLKTKVANLQMPKPL